MPSVTLAVMNGCASKIHNRFHCETGHALSDMLTLKCTSWRSHFALADGDDEEAGQNAGCCCCCCLPSVSCSASAARLDSSIGRVTLCSSQRTSHVSFGSP